MNKLARAVTKWAQACDTRLAHLISYIHHTCEYRQYCYVANTAQHRRFGLFQDSDFAGDLERNFEHVRNPNICTKKWMCKKQTSVSHSSTEAEVISPEAGLRMDGIHALNLLD